MTDIVERLRAFDSFAVNPKICKEAADEIESLRSQLSTQPATAAAPKDDPIVGHKTYKDSKGNFHHTPLRRSEADKILEEHAARMSRRKALMPTEQDAVTILFEAYQRLRDFGWRETSFAPTGVFANVIEAGSTGIHNAIRHSDWPETCWWVDGDSPSHPILYKPKQPKGT